MDTNEHGFSLTQTLSRWARESLRGPLFVLARRCEWGQLAARGIIWGTY